MNWIWTVILMYIPLGEGAMNCLPARTNPTTSIMSSLQHYVTRLNRDSTHVDEQLFSASQVANSASAALDALTHRRTYRATGKNVQCTSQRQDMCRRCSDGLLVVTCIDGAGRVRPVRECRYARPPQLTKSLVLLSRNETIEMYTRPNAIACCATQRFLDLCDCTPGFINGSDCTQCAPFFYGVRCSSCSCSSHGVCMDGVAGNGTCVCDTGWGGSDCSLEFKYYVVQKLLAPDGAFNDRLGFGGAGLSADGSFLSAASLRDDDLGDDSGSVHVWTSNGTSFFYREKLLAPDGAAQDELGTFGGVTLSSDGWWLSVASYNDDDLGEESGAVYVWLWNGTSFSFFQKLLAPDGAAYDRLGYGGVGLSSNGSVLSAASPEDDELGYKSGSVYVWIRNETNYILIQKLLAPDGSTYDKLGQDGVSLTSNGSILSAASRFDDAVASESGSIYVWVWNGTFFTFLQKLVAPDGAAGDHLSRGGVGLSAEGHILTAASFYDDDQGMDSGSVHVWAWNGTSFIYLQKLMAPDGAAGDMLGRGGVTLSADGLVLSAASPGDDERGLNSGSVHIWVWKGTSFIYKQKLLAVDGEVNDYFGLYRASLSLDGSTLSIVSPFDDDLNSASGSIYIAILGWMDTSISYQCVKVRNLSGCRCVFPYTGSTCAECLPGYYGPNCTRCTCSAHGVCSDGRIGNGSCACDPHWGGSTCSECLRGHYGSACHVCPLDCGDHGSCSDGVWGNGSCICDEGWTGEVCDSCLPNFYGSNCECSIGTCVDGLEGNGTCICENDWAESYCDKCSTFRAGLDCTIELNYHVAQKLLAPDGAAGDQLGRGGVSLSSNGSVLAVASPRDDDMGGDSGSIHVWVWNETSFTYLQKLLAPDGANGDLLGYGGVSLSSDGTVMSAASHEDDDLGDSSGSVHVWVWNETSFLYLQKLLTPDGATDDQLGHGGVTLSSDGSVLTAASFLDDYFGSESGSVHVWWRNGSYFSYVQRLIAPDGAAGDQLGRGGTVITSDSSILSVASYADYDLGSFSGSVYVAALGWVDTSISSQCIRVPYQSGCVCTFPYTGGGCQECLPGYYGEACRPCPPCSSHGVCADGRTGDGSCLCESGYYGRFCGCPADGYCVLDKVSIPDGAKDDQLGRGGVILSSDGSVMSAATHGDDHLRPDGGSLHVWVKNETHYLYRQKLLSPNGPADHFFGFGGVSMSSNGSVLTVASHLDGELGNNSGSVYVWVWNDTAYVYLQKLLAPDRAAGDMLGNWGAAVSADGTVLSAASWGQDELGSDSGSVYVWVRNGTSFSYHQKLMAPDGAPGDYLGYGGVSLSSDGSVLSAASHQDNDMGSDSGSVHVWVWNTSCYSYLQKLLTPDGAPDDRLGSGGVSLSSDGSLLSTAAYADDDLGSGSGSIHVWIWNATSSQFVYHQKLLTPAGAGGNLLGAGGVTLSANGAVLSAASYQDDDLGSNCGSVHVWGWNGTHFTYKQKLLAPDAAPYDHLGRGGVSLSANGSILAAAAHFDDDMGSHSGSVYIWTLSETAP